MLVAFLLAAAATPDPVAGEWHGTSLCQVPSSPCHDEQAVYRIEPRGNLYRVHFAKLVDGAPAEFGALDAQWDMATATLTMHSQDRAGRNFTWRLIKKAEHISGELRLDDGTLYRRAELDRVVKVP